jgi:hypothetical protein
MAATALVVLAVVLKGLVAEFLTVVVMVPLLLLLLLRLLLLSLLSLLNKKEEI